jgi:hypothetical protein
LAQPPQKNVVVATTTTNEDVLQGGPGTRSRP